MARKRDPLTGKLLPQGIHPMISDRTGEVTYRARVDYMEGTKRKYRSRVEKSVEAATTWQLRTRMRIQMGRDPDPTRITVNEYFHDWFARCVPDWSGSRQRSVMSTWNIHIEPAIGTIRLDKVRRFHIQEIIDAIVGNGCSSRTARVYMVQVTCMFKDALINGVIEQSPCHDLTYPKEKRIKRPVWLAEELHRYLTELHSGSYRYAGPLTLIGGTGCRIGEALAFHAEDLNLDEDTLWIHRTLSGDAEGELHIVNRTKTSEEGRVLPIQTWLKPMLSEFEGMQGVLWLRPDGRLINPTSVRNEHYAIINKLNLKPIRVHDIRHTMGSLLHANEIDFKTIQDILGHATSRSTEEYVHPHLEVLRGGLDRVSQSLGYAVPDTTTSLENEAI